MAGKGGSVLWDGQKDAGRGRRPYALCHLLWDWVGICLESPGSCSEVLRPGIPLSPECFVASNISLTQTLVGNAESRASLYHLSQNLHFTEIPSGILAPVERTWNLESQDQTWVLCCFTYYVTIEKAFSLSENWLLYPQSRVVIKMPVLLAVRGLQ